MADERRLALHAASKAYGPVVALDQMSFDVTAGELFGSLRAALHSSRTR